MAKLDIKSAFRLCPVRPADHHLLGMRWQGQYFFDRVLPFGPRSAPCIFKCLAEAIQWIAKQEGVTHIHHYLDDYFLAGTPGSAQCAQHLHTLTALCGSLGVPLAEEKLEGPTTCLEYLSILLDSASLEARLPPDKLQDIHSSLELWLGHTQSTKQEPLFLISTLSFAAKVVPAGHTFLRRMIDLSTTADSLQAAIPFSEAFQLDLQWWRAFITTWNGRNFFLLPTGPPLQTSTSTQTARAPLAMERIARATGSTAGGPQHSSHTASSGRNCTLSCWRRTYGGSAGPRSVSGCSATTRQWCTAS